MRRDIWLAGVAGAVVGSWLTLVAVQFGGHGFNLHGHSGSATTAENKPNTTTPAATPKPSDTAPAKSQPENQPLAQVAGSTPDKPTQPPTAPSSTASDGSAELSATAMAAAAAASAEAAVPQDDKVPTDPARLDNAPAKPQEALPVSVTPDAIKDKDSTSGQTAQPTEAASTKPAASTQQAAPAEEAKADPAPDNRIPADQIDRQTAANEHQTLPPQLQQAQPNSQPKPQSEPQPGPQSEQAALDPASKPPAQTTIELVRPFSDQAGILTIAGRSVQLTGVIPTDVGRMCTGPSGNSWPCGQAARTAFRMYLRGRSIDCDVPDADWKGTVTGACRYVRIDLSAWLVRFGWADPEPGSPLASLVDEARQKKRGMYGDDPRKTGKSTLAPAPAKEDPLNPI